MGDAMTPDHVGEFLAGNDGRRCDHHRGTGGEREDHLEHGRVEAGRGQSQYPRTARYRQISAGPSGEHGQSPVSDSDALGETGRA
ncbi:hypothetical protein B0E55_05461 [Rhodococcus sp. 66b]|nr:hypothetical protein B0E55_05461 [Rhodococcus sp. 66b]